MINALFPYLRRIRRMRSDIFRAFRFARASLVAALAFLLSLIILSSLLSCSPKRTVVVTLHSDSVAAAHRLLAGSRLSADTVVFRDSVIIDRSRDTISRTFVRWRDRVSVRHDTLRIESHDTVRIRTPTPPAPEALRRLSGDGDSGRVSSTAILILISAVIAAALCLVKSLRK